MSGKAQAKKRWKDREAKGVIIALEVLSHSIQVAPLKDGRINVKLGPPGGMGISFFIDQKLVLDAAQAGMIFAQEIKNKELNNGAGFTETNTQPVGGE